MIEESSDPTGREAHQRRGQERPGRQANDDALARTPDHEPSSAADMTDSAAAVLDHLREVAAAHDQDRGTGSPASR